MMNDKFPVQPSSQKESEQARQAWITKYGLKESRATNGFRNLLPAGSKFRKIERRTGDWYRLELDLGKSVWFDHIGLYWNPSENRYWFTSQPYDLTDKDYTGLQVWCESIGVEVELSWEGWHYPRFCPLLTFKGADRVFCGCGSNHWMIQISTVDRRLPRR